MLVQHMMRPSGNLDFLLQIGLRIRKPKTMGHFKRQQRRSCHKARCASAESTKRMQALGAFAFR
jgi:hypothetical protein